MSKAFRVLACTLLAGLMLSPVASADEPGTFTIVWVIDLPRVSYFIGENVTFQVTALSSLDPTLKIPGQYVNIAIRNGTNEVVYDLWMMTDTNGTIIVAWNSPVQSEPGRYTIIVTDGMGNTVGAEFDMLFDEGIYWQSRMEELEKELTQVYEYLNYLFAQTNYLKASIEAYRDVLYVVLAFLCFCLILTMIAWFPTMAQRLQSAGAGANPIRALGLMMGFGNPLRTHIDHVHEDMSNTYTPPGKSPPRYGRDRHCEKCDPEKKYPLTAWELRVHEREEHGRWSNAMKLKRAQKMKRLISDFEKETRADGEPKRGEYARDLKKAEKRLSRMKTLARKILPDEAKEKPRPTDVSDDVERVRGLVAGLKAKVERGELTDGQRQVELEHIRSELTNIRAKRQPGGRVRKLKDFSAPTEKEPHAPTPPPARTPPPTVRPKRGRKTDAIYDKVTGEVVYRDGIWYKNPGEM